MFFVSAELAGPLPVVQPMGLDDVLSGLDSEDDLDEEELQHDDKRVRAAAVLSLGERFLLEMGGRDFEKEAVAESSADEFALPGCPNGGVVCASDTRVCLEAAFAFQSLRADFLPIMHPYWLLSEGKLNQGSPPHPGRDLACNSSRAKALKLGIASTRPWFLVASSTDGPSPEPSGSLAIVACLKPCGDMCAPVFDLTGHCCKAALGSLKQQRVRRMSKPKQGLFDLAQQTVYQVCAG